MIINGTGRIATSLSAPDTAPGGTTPPLLGEALEQELGEWEGDFLHFGSAAMPFVREEFRSRIACELSGYLELGYLDSDDAVGPVQRKVASADHADGVDPQEVNLMLREDALVFGFLDNQGVGDCYYVCASSPVGLAFFCICIESGVASGGPYDIYVSAPMAWEDFTRQLPPL